jgi:tetratricopeptide (TPR) repeat protein
MGNGSGTIPMGVTGSESTSIGYAKDLPLPPEIKKSHPSQEKPPTSSPQFFTKNDYDKLVAKLKQYNVRLEGLLDEKGDLKPEKVEEIKVKIKAAFDKFSQSSAIKKLDPSSEYLREFVGFLRNKTALCLFSSQDQKAFLAGSPLKLEGTALTDAVFPLRPAARIALAIRLEAQGRAAQGNIEEAARIFEHAVEINPQDKDLRLETAQAKKAWGDKETDPKIKNELYKEAFSHLDAILRKEPGAHEELKFKKNASASKLMAEVGRLLADPMLALGHFKKAATYLSYAIQNSESKDLKTLLDSLKTQTQNHKGFAKDIGDPILFVSGQLNSVNRFEDSIEIVRQAAVQESVLNASTSIFVSSILSTRSIGPMNLVSTKNQSARGQALQGPESEPCQRGRTSGCFR